MSAERKKFGIRRISRVRVPHPFVAQVVPVEAPGYKATTTITFTDEFVSYLGGKMPMGIGPHLPACISVDKDRGEFVVSCIYLLPDRDDLIHTELWRTVEPPAWLIPENKGTNERTTSKANPPHLGGSSGDED